MGDEAAAFAPALRLHATLTGAPGTIGLTISTAAGAFAFVGFAATPARLLSNRRNWRDQRHDNQGGSGK